MAGCKICGYYIPDDAKKCAHCGEVIDEDLRKNKKRWKWLSFGTNIATLLASFATLGMATAIIWQTRILNSQARCIETQTKIMETTFKIQNIPNIKIDGIFLYANEYTEKSGDKSVAALFQIPIKNNSQGAAYDVEIVKKELDSLRKKVGLDDTSLQSPLTNRKFYLAPGSKEIDRIFIDFSPQDFKQYQNGTAFFSIEYEIHYRALREVRKEPFVYKYKILFTKGVFQDSQIYEYTEGK